MENSNEHKDSSCLQEESARIHTIIWARTEGKVVTHFLIYVLFSIVSVVTCGQMQYRLTFILTISKEKDHNYISFIIVYYNNYPILL